MDFSRLAQLLFPEVQDTPEDLELRFPPRALPEGARVTRIAPSPTGSVHFGTLFPAMVSETLAHAGGVFFLRIEDTDDARYVEGAVEQLFAAFSYYHFEFNEGPREDGGEQGAYGPYVQSKRGAIYKVFAKALVEKGLAYPCFCSAEELSALREEQEKQKELPGYYGQYAHCRTLSLEDIEAKLSSGALFTLRLRSPGKVGGRVRFTDLVKGELELDENFMDAVLLKSNGMPTYHFAHAVDDHLMRVTHVVRGEEWLSSVPLHLQLFSALGFRPPKYVHLSDLLKQSETGGKRKLSKRRDPEGALSFYRAQGYPASAVRDYVMGVLNSNFEDWRRANPMLPLCDFPFSLKKMSPSGALFDLNKLEDVSKNRIARMDAETVYRFSLSWAQEFDADFARRLSEDENYAKAIFSIGRGGEKPRKDFSKWSEVPGAISFFYDDLFSIRDALPEGNAKADAAKLLKRYKEVYEVADGRDDWFAKIRALACEFGYAEKPKEYQEHPESFRGHVGDVSAVLRLALTGALASPDLYDVMQVLGAERVRARLDTAKL